MRSLAWHPPACTGWSLDDSSIIVALAGRFAMPGGVDQVLARIGAVSTLPAVLYWSVTEKSWRPLALEASALSGKSPKSRRPDFSSSELVPGPLFHYWMRDYQAGPVVYSLRVLERSAQRIVVASQNVTSVHFLFLTLLAPGDIQTVEFIERPGREEIWQVYILARIKQPKSRLAWGQEASSINRLVALYRRLAGIPTDQEPPATP
ncbi:MAG TPA: DUF6675 family protein [Rhodocyclaceae bacterium]|nr:DUF6675 family protein [Rhodocyclaceae bacterium]